MAVDLYEGQQQWHSIHRAQELTKNMYAISYIHARSKQAVERVLGMDEEQRNLYDLIDMVTQS